MRRSYFWILSIALLGTSHIANANVLRISFESGQSDVSGYFDIDTSAQSTDIGAGGTGYTQDFLSYQLNYDGMTIQNAVNDSQTYFYSVYNDLFSPFSNGILYIGDGIETIFYDSQNDLTFLFRLIFSDTSVISNPTSTALLDFENESATLAEAANGGSVFTLIQVFDGLGFSNNIFSDGWFLDHEYTVNSSVVPIPPALLMFLSAVLLGYLPLKSRNTAQA